MRVRVPASVIRRLIREVAFSPSLPNSTKIVSDPMEKKNIATAVTDVEGVFKSALVTNLVLANWEAHYNAETREFNDAAFQKIDSVADKLSKQLTAKFKDVVASAWQVAHNSVKGQS